MSRKKWLKKRIRKFEKKFDKTPIKAVLTRQTILNKSAKYLDELEDILNEEKLQRRV